LNKDLEPVEEPKARKNRRSKDEDANLKAKHWAREWLDAFIFAAIAALILRTFFFGAYRIPTPSMEQTLLTGDFLLVSKVAYGPRTPMTIAFPFTDIYLPGVNLPWFRIPGYSEVKRNDIVVFNYPIDIAPISVKTNYIKRAVGVPGDRLEIRDKVVYVNGEPEEGADTFMYHYMVNPIERARISPAKVREAGGNIIPINTSEFMLINMTAETAAKIESWAEVASVEHFVRPNDQAALRRRGFSFSFGFTSLDNIPEFTVPYEGQEIVLDPETWHLYRDVVERYENNRVSIEDGVFLINGEVAETYTIQQDYYFTMGDNRDDSEDGRFWGFVPDDHIVGKASVIYFSWDGERMLPRLRRMFNLIH
jgi:signal peptidase I